jgi:hypothetical protein
MRHSYFLVAAALFALAGIGVAVGLAVRSGDDTPAAGPGDPGTMPDVADSPLHRARLDAARRLGIDVLKVHLVELRAAGFNGCLGVVKPGQACTEQFIEGYIAIFEAGGERLRYHFGGSQYVGPVDPAEASDGIPTLLPVRIDVGAILAAYARHEAAIRLAIDVRDAAITLIEPASFGNRCLGFGPTGEACAEKGPLTGGWFVRIGADGRTIAYSLIPSMVRYHDPALGETFHQPSQRVVDLQDAMRSDLASRLGIDVAEVSVTSYRTGTWNDGCLGIRRPDALCTMALVDGFLAILAAGDTAYRYHGDAQGRFFAASFEAGAFLDDPAFSD